MTRLAILSDIHGNLPALEAVLKDVAAFQPDQIVVLGDSVNWGPFSAQVMTRLYQERVAMIRGNHEYYILDHGTPRAPETWKHYRLSPWTREQLGQAHVRSIAALPDTLQLRFPDAPPLRVVHGVPGNPWEGIYHNTLDAEIVTFLDSVQEDTILTGHTHLTLDRQSGRWRILNPGSVGLPLIGNMLAHYMIMDGDAAGWRIQRRHLKYDVSPIFAEFERLHFVDAVGVEAHMVLKEFETGLCYIAPFNRWFRQTYPDQMPGRVHVDEFLRIDPDPYRPATHQLVAVDDLVYE